MLVTIDTAEALKRAFESLGKAVAAVNRSLQGFSFAFHRYSKEEMKRIQLGRQMLKRHRARRKHGR